MCVNRSKLSYFRSTQERALYQPKAFTMNGSPVTPAPQRWVTSLTIHVFFLCQVRAMCSRHNRRRPGRRGGSFAVEPLAWGSQCLAGLQYFRYGYLVNDLEELRSFVCTFALSGTGFPPAPRDTPYPFSRGLCAVVKPNAALPLLLLANSLHQQDLIQISIDRPMWGRLGVVCNLRDYQNLEQWFKRSANPSKFS